MRNWKKKVVIGLSMVLIVVSIVLIGCNGDKSLHRGSIEPISSDKPYSVSLVLGVHDYFPSVSLNAESIYDKIYRAAYTNGDASAVVIDGNPYVGCNFSIKKPSVAVDEQKKRQLAKKNTEQIITNMSAVSAKTSEIDTLSAISLSADTLHSVQGESEKSMIIYDSGLSTTGLLNFADKNIINESPDYIVEQLKELHAIPDLSGINNVVWVGCGTTCGEQEKLTSSYKYKLQTLWESILVAGGAETVTFDTTPVLGEECAVDLPSCSVVPVVADCLDVGETVTKKYMPEVIKWDGDSKLCFKGDVAEFIDYVAAEKEMEPIAVYLKTNQNEQIYIFGMTATIVGGDSGIELSEARANACKKILVDKGVSESQIVCVGLGQTEHSLRVRDIGENGLQIKKQAQKNRAVLIVKAESKLVDILMKSVTNGNVV